MTGLLIESREQLEHFCSDIGDQPLIAVDTEFFRETTYFAELALVQIAAGEHIACIDVLAFDAREPLAGLLLNPAIGKVFHSCLQDLEVLYQYFGQLPAPILDTQVAAALLDSADQVGYARLVEHRLGVSLDKSQTRTNWLQRPLSRKQLEYAADDVRYLAQLYPLLLQELEDAGRVEWFMQDCAALSASSSRFEPDFDYCWKRVRGTQRLGGQQLAVVDSIARWREAVAIETNLTRRRVLSDETLVQLAASPPATLEALEQTRPLPRNIGQQYLQGLFAAIQAGTGAAPENWPETRANRPDAAAKTLLKRLQSLVNDTAETLGIAPSILCSRRELEKLIEGNTTLSVLSGWRRETLGEALLAALQG